jgi:hypothetical protein
MVLKIAGDFGLKIDPKDASILSKLFIFTPGNIKASLLYVADILAGQRERGIERDNNVKLDELTVAFRRKAVTMAGTTVKLAERFDVPDHIDPALFFTDDLDLNQLGQLANGQTAPKLWLLMGRPETEITELAMFAASRSGDCEVIQIGSFGTSLLEQMEAAKRNRVSIVITVIDNFFDQMSSEEIRTHPLLIAAQDHVTNGHSVFLISDHTGSQLSPALRRIFGSTRRACAGFNLVAGYDLLCLINRIAGVEIPTATQRFFDQTASLLLDASIATNPLTYTGENSGLVVAGPKDIRNALQELRLEETEINLQSIFSTLLRQGVPCTSSREEIRDLTGLSPSFIPHNMLN